MMNGGDFATGMILGQALGSSSSGSSGGGPRSPMPTWAKVLFGSLLLSSCSLLGWAVFDVYIEWQDETGAVPREERSPWVRAYVFEDIGRTPSGEWVELDPERREWQRRQYGRIRRGTFGVLQARELSDAGNRLAPPPDPIREDLKAVHARLVSAGFAEDVAAVPDLPSLASMIEAIEADPDSFTNDELRTYLPRYHRLRPADHEERSHRELEEKRAAARARWRTERNAKR